MRSFFIFICLISFSSALAQDRSFDCLESGVFSESRSKNLLDKVQKAYSGISTIQAKFIQNSYVDALEVSEVSSGQVWFEKPGLMKWHYSAPSEQIFVIRDGTLWLYQAEPQQVIIDDFKEALISDLPVSFLLGIGDIKKDFRLLKACQNPEGIVMDLAPVQSGARQAELKSFRLMVNADTFLPKGASVMDVGNNSTAMLLEQIILNADLKQEVFSAEFGSGLDISDRRIERREAGK